MLFIKNDKPVPKSLVWVLLLTPWIYFQSWANVPLQTITGKVTSAKDGSPIVGVNVRIKGSSVGTTTNQAGQYSISTSSAQTVLLFSFIGYQSQEIVVGTQTLLDVALVESDAALQEVVVTALGIQRDKRLLGYSVGEVQGKDITRVAQENVLNSLAGKVAGVQISQTGPTGSSVSMVIRGAKSLSNDNQPLFVVDGVPLANSLNNVTEMGSGNKVDYGNAISDLNPEDIESVSVLKGPSAAALYGSRAGNGVVLITTKSGSKVKKMTISVTTNTVLDRPFRFLERNNQFASGVFPYTPAFNPYPGGVLQIEEGSAAGNGPELDKGYKAIQWNSPRDANGNLVPLDLVSHPDNVRNFVQTGITSMNGISIANSTDRMSYRLSYANMRNRGVIPGSDLYKNTLSLNSTVKLHKKLTLSSSIDVSRNNSNNRPSGDRGTNPMQWAYAVSPHIDIRDLKNYWVSGKEGIEQRTQAAGEYNNPYYLAHEVKNSFVRDRMFGNLKMDWQLTPELSLMARYAVDTYTEQRETKIPFGYTDEPKGAYGITNMTRYERNADFLATYKKDLNQFHFSVSAGGNVRYQNGTDQITSSKNKAGLILPNLYTVQNIAVANINYSNSRFQRGINSLYALANLGFKDMIYLDITGRNDWSSTLPADSRSYFYPSASLSVLVNEMVPIPQPFNLVKLRAGVAQVGTDANPYNLYNTLANAGAWDGITRLGTSATLLTPNLKPEIATSTEVGLDLALLHNRLRFAGTYYISSNKNQIISTTLPSSSGYSSKNVNAGLLESRGVELSLGGTPIDRNGWRWDVTANFTKNTTTIKRLSDGLKSYTLWTDAKGGAWTYVGEKIGDIYDAELVTVTDPASPYYGYPILDKNGSWQAVSASNTRNKIGNFNADFMLGLQTSLSYKRFTLNMSFDWRQGGNFISQTYRYMESDFKTSRFLNNVINPNGLSGDALRNHLVAHADQMIRVNGNNFHVVGGPTAAYGSYPFESGGVVYPYGGVFNPGVIAQYDANGNITGYTENLGSSGTKYLPYADNYPWDFARAALFDASFLKLREVSLAYELPSAFVRSLGLQNASFSVYSRNIMLWTAAKIGIDPETAFQPQSGTQAGTQFKQGIERYNVTPWVIPVGFKLGLTF
ncbi:SusC/RagA family TonB-linked outer membrane protein [Siphonobacter curvatus]|uniref:SusC/RagA family TonB-linked outer membrane protein n=1 Tax=Siphonobacter curvatus TaxID=2094562 RepID=A0A2S7IPU4_9BACT|nr:SusC/RagA family TonB-linked outer membrane protein [Siphonobacter curvatus]PQA59737.1 SusC/RagA family TonB-linked outer membrane protein [Siphonobacter curvatus]